MKRIFLLLCLAAVVLQVGAQVTIKDENVELREAKNFTGIGVSGSFTVYISHGEEETIAVSAARKEYLQGIRVEVKNGVLHLRYDHQNLRWVGRNLQLKAYISYKTLQKLDLSGAATVKLVDTWNSDRGTVKLSGASDLKGNVEVDDLRIEQSGASDAKLTGKATRLFITASGASNFKGYDFTAQSCDAHASGASDIRISVSEELQVRASGASDVYYKGQVTRIDVRTSGASTVARK